MRYELLQAVHKVGYDKPTPIQMQAIPIAFEKRDMIGTANLRNPREKGATLMIQGMRTVCRTPFKNTFSWYSSISVI